MDCELEQKEPCERKLSAWVITYHLHTDTDYYEGVAVVQAYEVKEAECIFLANSCFNSCRERICIEAIKEIYCLPEPDLLAEVKVKEFNIYDRRAKLKGKNRG